ncbi:hypothetical protein GF345_03460 [Candidatus Woesearchaeota archaeon]|nr:hypothetical protein [Candidatus Woesearchaeota archaeon]
MPKDIEEESIDEKNEFIEDTDERPETDDEKDKMMEEGKLEEDVYSDVGRENLVKDGEIEDWEEGFAKGAEEGGRDAKCRYCGKILIEKENVVEREIDGDLYFFCSDEHAGKYLQKKQKESS